LCFVASSGELSKFEGLPRYRAILRRQCSRTPDCAVSPHGWRGLEEVSQIIIIIITPSGTIGPSQFTARALIKAANSVDRARARAHVGVCAGLRPMRTAQHSRPSSVEQDVRIPVMRGTAGRKKRCLWLPADGAISMFKFGHMYAFWVEPKCSL